MKPSLRELLLLWKDDIFTLLTLPLALYFYQGQYGPRS